MVGDIVGTLKSVQATVSAGVQAAAKVATPYAASAASSLTNAANASASTQARGLHNFIAELRDSKSKDEEASRIDKELGNIRQKFANPSNLSSYQRKKYAWKLCYIYMMGYEVDFGHLEFISLISSTKYQEKVVGYMAVALFFKPTDEVMTLAINSIRNDLVSRVDYGQALALAVVSNIGGSDLAEALCGDVQRLVVSTNEWANTSQDLRGINATSLANITKKALLCLLRLFRTNPDCLDIYAWVTRVAKLLEDSDIGINTCAMNFAVGLALHNSEAMQPLVPYVLSLLTRLVMKRGIESDHMYYRTASPWLQVKCLRFLQFYDAPPEETQCEHLNDLLFQILDRTEVSDSVSKSNADHSILFEGIKLVVSYGLDANTELRDCTINLLVKFIAVRDANIRYLGLDAMNTMVKNEGAESVKGHQAAVLESIKDTDISVRKRALELLYSLADVDSAAEIVGELLLNLSSAEAVIKEDIVVKIAILAEKFADGRMQWYIDTMVRIVLLAGDFVSEAVWHRVVVIVTNRVEVHEYAADRMFDIVSSKFAHDIAVVLAGYLLGEIGVNICEKEGRSGYDQFAALHQHFSLASVRTKGVLLSCYVKLLNLYPDTRDVVNQVFMEQSTSPVLELQQRACEYLQLPGVGAEVMEQVLNTMPPYPEDKENNLMLLNEGSSGSAPTVKVSTSQVKQRGDREAGAAASTPVQRGSAQAPVIGDLLAMDDSASPAASLAQAAPTPALSRGASLFASPITDEQEDEVAAASCLYAAATIAGPGTRSLLLSSAAVIVASSAEFRAHHGRLVLFFSNKSQGDISKLEVVIPPSQELNIKQQPLASSIAPGGELSIVVAVECLKPFVDSPVMNISFFVGSGGRTTHTLRLPITAASFFEPVPSDKATYLSRWKVLENEVQEIFTSSHTLDSNFFVHLREVVVPALKLGTAAELDTTERTFTGSCSFRTGTAGADGALVSVGAMLRLEGDPTQSRFRITVRSKHIKVSQALVQILKGLLQ